MKDIISIVHFKDFFSNFWLSFYKNINYKNYRNSIVLKNLAFKLLHFNKVKFFIVQSISLNETIN